MTWTYSTVLATPKDQVRLIIGDTQTADQQLQDEEINYLVTQRNDVNMAAADACEALAARYSRQADTTNLSLRIAASQRAKRYADMVLELKAKALALSGATMDVGGTSISGKLQRATNADEVQPSFGIGIDDEPGANPNTLPPYLDPLLNSGS